MSTSFAQLRAGTPLEPFSVEIPAAANDRYWDGAGVEHPLRTAGALYPLIAANLTVLTFGRRCPDAMIQTRQRLVCHRRADAPATLRTTGLVSERDERRGRTYIVVETQISERETPLWSSTVVFTPAAVLEHPQRKQSGARRERKATADATNVTRSLHITEELVRRYSRRGNFHSEHATSESLGLPGLVAQGTQVTGPAYGLLLDAWGEEFLSHGELDVRFVGMVLAGQSVTASVMFDTPEPGAAAAGALSAETRTNAHADATIEIVTDRNTTAVVGTASLRHTD